LTTRASGLVTMTTGAGCRLFVNKNIVKKQQK
jgi:hypothetical protein